TERAIAVKFLDLSGLGEDSSRERYRLRFHRECVLMSALKGQHFPHVYGFGIDGYFAFLAMELVDGPNLKEFLARYHPVEIEVVVSLAAQICAGIITAHDAGVVHRDLKPANVMIDSDGSVKILDFGIASAPDVTTLTSTGAAPGTYAYMAPERF